MGMIAKRTVDYLQRNGYINESVQKAGIPGIPGCIPIQSGTSSKKRSPKKAFMDDVTLLTQNQKMMEKVLARLDDLITWSRMRFKAKKSRSLTFVEGGQRQVKFFTNKITQRQTTRAGMGTGRLLQISLNANGSSRSPHRKSRILLFGVWRER